MTTDIGNANYVPTIYLRQAELKAVKELPDSAKDILCPIFCLKPWTTAKLLSAAMLKIEEAFPSRGYFLDIDPFKKTGEIKRPAQKEFADLLDPSNGNLNWVNFFEQYPNAQPCIVATHGDLVAIMSQVEAFSKQEKFFLMRLNRQSDIQLDYHAIIEKICSLEHSNFGFVIDVGWARDLLPLEDWASDLVRRITEKKGGGIPIVLTGSSFPVSFERFSLGDSVELRERQLFDLVRSKNNIAKLIYGDWASSRSPTEGGGGHPIPPRLELSLGRSWEIYRANSENPSFKKLAEKLSSNKNYPSKLGIWATYMIAATKAGLPSAIDSLRKAAAVRINLHLYQQLFFQSGSVPTDTDDDYSGI